MYEGYIKKGTSLFFLDIVLYELDNGYLLCFVIARMDIDARGFIDHEDIIILIEDASFDIYYTLELEGTWFIFLYIF